MFIVLFSTIKVKLSESSLYIFSPLKLLTKKKKYRNFVIRNTIGKTTRKGNIYFLLKTAILLNFVECNKDFFVFFILNSFFDY